MKQRRFGRLGWQVSEIGYGMWGMGDWSGSEDEASMQALHRSVALGCNFFDTAFAYGDGRSEKLLGRLVRAHPDKRLYTASKIAPMNGRWPALPEYRLKDVFPPDYIRRSIETTLRNLDQPALDLIQLHVWTDEWAADESWQRALDDARREGLVRGIGISINRWEPTNAVKALRTGVVDAVQVIYNIFDQNPEDELYPVCRELDIGVIARVPFDEGTLTGTLTKDSRWPEGDWRNTYFTKENLHPSVDRAERLRPLVPAGMTMAEMALRFILAEPTVHTIIPGMRKLANVDANIATSDGRLLDPALMSELRKHRWVRHRQPWSD
jgi:aryl-alcohol dehydrogenase-like predicted oxidoreductase